MDEVKRTAFVLLARLVGSWAGVLSVAPGDADFHGKDASWVAVPGVLLSASRLSFTAKA
jgi:hypothetical protein